MSETNRGRLGMAVDAFWERHPIIATAASMIAVAPIIMLCAVIILTEPL